MQKKLQCGKNCNAKTTAMQKNLQCKTKEHVSSAGIIAQRACPTPPQTTPRDVKAYAEVQVKNKESTANQLCPALRCKTNCNAEKNCNVEKTAMQKKLQCRKNCNAKKTAMQKKLQCRKTAMSLKGLKD